MIGQPGFMPPPPMGPINDTPTGGGKAPGGFSGPMFNFTFNPGGGISPSSPTPQGGPTNRPPGGGPGWMPPPPIQPVGGGDFQRINPWNLQPLQPQFSPPNFFPPVDPKGSVFGDPSRRPSGGPGFSPPAVGPGGGMPGWAGYLQWLQSLGGKFPPPQIGGI